MSDFIATIRNRIKTQDNRCTSNPMFCVQERKRESCLIPGYGDGTEWIDMQSGEYETVEPETPGAEQFGYRDRWETVMVAFTEEGCKEYLRVNGHNHGETRIYAESFGRCVEMITIREFLLADPWIPVDERLPDGKVIARYLNRLGNERQVIASYVPRWTVESNGEHEEYDEYSEDKDVYYYREGWYEQIDNWDEHSGCFIHEGKVTHWMPLPPGPGVSDE